MTFYNKTGNPIDLARGLAATVRNEFSLIDAGFDAVEVKTDAAIKLNDGETATALGNAVARANKVLTFDASGNPVNTYTIADVATVSGIAAAVTTVAGISADVTAVAADAADIGTVAANIADVDVVAAGIANVNAVGADLLEPVSEIDTVATNIANVNIVGNDIANVNATGGNIANVNTVAGISANVTSVAGNATNINTVAANSANVTTVATDIASVNSAATNMAAIIDAPNQASAAASSASTALGHANNAAASASAALGSANAAAASYDQFDDRYLGSKAADPTLDNDGNALLTGALYWNSVAGQMRVYDGAAWQVAYLPASGYVSGPRSATDGNIALFDGATGKVIKDSGKSISEISGKPTLSGTTTIYVTQEITYTITNYNSFSTYAVAASAGTVSRAGDQITYTAGSSAGTATLTVTMDGADSEFEITVQPVFVAAPTITSPANGATGLGQAPTFTSSEFDTIDVADTFLNADHEIRTGPNGTGTLIASSYADTGSETSWTMPGSLLATATTYYYRKLHRGAALGASGWSEISFTTKALFGGLIGTQGGQGFGVGVCPNGSLLVALGLAAMTGTTDPAHANYGNYQHSNGSIVCYVPKHFVRVGHASSPRYATYGANAHDIVGIETFANEAAANAAGYYMPRAFVNGGIELGGFFYDKYLASKDGTTSCKSVFGGTPISLTAEATYTNSSGMTGCTGIYADAVVLAKARGSGWHCASVFQSSAVAILSLAHRQAAISTTYCAWYDASATTNFPKGCNNGALADHLDGSVTYASAGDSENANKPKAGATANFAKTTHNGQACGIADINGSMWQVLLGITAPGTSGTDTTEATTGAAYQSAYVLKRSTDIATLTAGWTAGASGTDAWGDAAHLAALYDAVSDIFPWTARVETYFGNGANQVFDGSASGTGYLRTACGIPKNSSATSPTGTSQFGNDYNFIYNHANLFVRSAGYWDAASSTGAFCRYWNSTRSGVGGGAGFRAAACG